MNIFNVVEARAGEREKESFSFWFCLLVGKLNFLLLVFSSRIELIKKGVSTLNFVNVLK